ncbi:tol-pal system protein YbgF [Marinomonas ostreistagni]|uniref:tol-pal system protein YbgF n=1 Tax=Marinomonas ostreistagni TaxID=359209 RepID=UPI00194F5DBE|nr:tol-pal system protein YbgF [Marinomonas ostreistagni]MBM6549973.1 tol-pal system protein YbgF [Marinomonas ostreistagni]
MSFRLAIGSTVLVLTLSAPTALAADNSSGISSSVAADLLYQLETMQQEVSQLRGQVERQQYELDKMKALQKDRYIDLDKRIAEAMTQARKSAAPAQTISGSVEQDDATNMVASAPVRAAELDPASDEAKQAYDAAYQLIKDKQFEQAQQAFREFVKAHPNNVLTGNSHYWLGELALVLGNQGEALLQFKTVIDSFAGHSKVSDATYKLGIANDQMGNQTLARDYFNRTIENFPDSNAAKLATNYLNNMK